MNTISLQAIYSGPCQSRIECVVEQMKYGVVQCFDKTKNISQFRIVDALHANSAFDLIRTLSASK